MPLLALGLGLRLGLGRSSGDMFTPPTGVCAGVLLGTLGGVLSAVDTAAEADGGGDGDAPRCDRGRDKAVVGRPSSVTMEGAHFCRHTGCVVSTAKTATREARKPPTLRSTPHSDTKPCDADAANTFQLEQQCSAFTYPQDASSCSAHRCERLLDGRCVHTQAQRTFATTLVRSPTSITCCERTVP